MSKERGDNPRELRIVNVFAVSTILATGVVAGGNYLENEARKPTLIGKGHEITLYGWCTKVNDRLVEDQLQPWGDGKVVEIIHDAYRKGITLASISPEEHRRYEQEEQLSERSPLLERVPNSPDGTYTTYSRHLIVRQPGPGNYGIAFLRDEIKYTLNDQSKYGYDEELHLVADEAKGTLDCPLKKLGDIPQALNGGYKRELEHIPFTDAFPRK